MIKVGDYIKHKDNGMIYKVVSSSEKLLYVTDFKQTWQHIGVDVATNNFIVVDYKQLYEQQKQRADELESLLYTYKENAKSIPDLIEQIQASNKRADELENILAYIKSHLNDLWHNGDATEHEYAYNTLKYIESLQENNNA